uniref:S1C family serine protease n=1 Tax=Gelidibacter sp. TaxID=2018083 RepID=UPI004048F036
MDKENSISSSLEDLKSKENELLKRELELKERELQFAKEELEKGKLEKEKDIPISELYKEIKRGVFIIYAQGEENISQGTGFFLDNFGTAISNYHVLEEANKAIVILDDGERGLINKIIDYDKELDYVIFSVDNILNNYIPLEVSNIMPEIGSTCFAVGNPRGLTQTLSIGNISGFRNNENLIQTTTEITHGSSGGPLFNKEGKVIGMTSSGIGEANLNFAINMNSIPYQNFLTSTSPHYAQPIPVSDIKSIISKYYYYINNEEYSSLYNIYNNKLDRFFDYFNISSDEAVNKAKSYKSKFKITSSANEINWSTLKIESLDDNSYFITFNMNYHIERIDKNKAQNFNIDIIMNMTSDMKIKSIYENIIKSN